MSRKHGLPDVDHVGWSFSEVVSWRIWLRGVAMPIWEFLERSSRLGSNSVRARVAFCCLDFVPARILF